jgi:small-conductance mechanosensitive channel
LTAIDLIFSVDFSDPAVLAFVVIPVTLALGLAWGASVSWRRAGADPSTARRVGILTLAASAVWMATTWIVAATGILVRFDRSPPPFAILVLTILVLAFVIAFSRLGARLSTHLPLWLLVAVQGFRFPLELAMHAMYERGVMPIQMSYSGRNFDILTGVSAIAVAFLVWSSRGGRRLVLAWNILGLALLVNVIAVAVLGTPKFQYFGPDHLNLWVTIPPFVWLPAVMVLAALTGHLLIFRALLGSGRES